ncbi:MAG: DUF1992 domain-containing protein [Proteobacteria bacterium]|nr:DUF1992 domain-containing protein [Pseudomonadota bacterium]
MIPGYEKIVEERILKAQKNGDFDNLEGTGKPIHYEDETGIPEDLRLAYKILKNAGCIPPELETSREIRQTEDLLKCQPDTKEKYRLMKKLNMLLRKRTIEAPAFASVSVMEQYHQSLVDRISKKA